MADLDADAADAPLEERSRRIVETAIELAEQGGFEAVRLREVAAHAGVALGTLYRRFRSKEDLLVAALDLETADLERRVYGRLPKGDTELERVAGFFAVATRGLFRRPNLARALLRATASGEPDLAQKVARFHARVERMIVSSLRGAVVPGEGEVGEPPSEREQQLTNTLNLIWFGLLVSWNGGQRSQAAIMEQMRASAALLLEG